MTENDETGAPKKQGLGEPWPVAHSMAVWLESTRQRSSAIGANDVLAILDRLRNPEAV
jgi:hypothetical protein